MLEELDVVGVGHREGVVGRDGSTFVVERLEQREVDDPEELQATLVHRRTAELHPQRAEHVVDQATSAGGDQQEVAGLGAHRVDGPELLGLGQATIPTMVSCARRLASSVSSCQLGSSVQIRRPARSAAS